MMLFRTSSRPEAGRYGRSRRTLGTLTCALALVVGGSVATAPTATAAIDPDPIIFGASGGYQITKLERNIGAPLAEHGFGKLSGPVKSGRMVNIKPTVRWRQVANAGWSSSIHADIRRWADALKKRSGPVLVAFSHEPESRSSDWLGNSDDFKAAWRKVYSVFQRRGAHNVEFTWTMTAYSFIVKPGDDRHHLKWYPGDGYVDNVGADAYNFYNCGPGRGDWLSLEHRARKALQFAKSRNKPLVLPEWASQSGWRRAAWLRAARTWLINNRSSIRAVFYFQSPYLRPGCHFRLNTSTEYQIFGSMAKDRTNFQQ